MAKLSHLNQRGEAHMVDVGDKPVSHRVAIAEGTIHMQPQTLDRYRTADAGYVDKDGFVFVMFVI